MAKSICLFKEDIKFERLKLDEVKQEKVRQITNIICALLNTNGGQVDIFMDNVTNGNETIHNFIRAIEQRFHNTIGGLDTNEKIVQQPVTHGEKITFVVTALEDYLCTLNYNLFLPGTPQAQIVKPNEPITAIERLVEGKQKAIHREQIQLGSHCRMFTIGEQCEDEFLLNCNVICKPTKVGRDVKNEISKQSNFQKQVSALANDAGGHIYYGFKSRKVEGVFVKENEIKSITSAIEEALTKLIWGGDKNPKRHREWNVYFEPVKDENGDIIEHTFVIVVSIASYKGGVFTAEPECYHVVQGNVEKMDFSNWKKELLRRRTLRQCKRVDEFVHSIRASNDFASLG